MTCFSNLSPDLLEARREAAEGRERFEEKAGEGDRRLLFA